MIKAVEKVKKAYCICTFGLDVCCLYVGDLLHFLQYASKTKTKTKYYWIMATNQQILRGKIEDINFNRSNIAEIGRPVHEKKSEA